MIYNNAAGDGTDAKDANMNGNMGEHVEAVLNIKNLIEEDTEYMLKINVTTEKKTASYYTRIILETDCILMIS